MDPNAKKMFRLMFRCQNDLYSLFCYRRISDVLVYSHTTYSSVPESNISEELSYRDGAERAGVSR